ncbi:MAG: PD-(D/E)XK nuclease family protein, partial [Clostridia bacterium]|nr:PD-(D/E)XK nuclease family protein [Clostridia bacterium]
DNFNSENIEVLSFTKLYSVVANLSGFGRLPVMSDSERLLLTDAAFKSSTEQLRIFDKYVNYSDFSVKIADIIRDFKFAAATSEDIMSAAENIGGSCGAKLHDIAVIMSVYDALISDKFIDASDYLTRLFSILSDFSYFENKQVFFDSFTGFTGQQMKIIEKILEQADDVTFSFCTDDFNNSDLNVFYNINKTARKILEIAKSRNVKLGETLYLKDNFYSNETLKSLEKSFFDSCENNNIDTSDYLRIISAADPRQEAHAAINIVKNLVNNQNYRFRDFIIVARNADEYKEHIELFSKKCGVQCFIDRKVNLSDTLLYIYIQNLLKIKLAFTTENILNFLKCGFHNYREEDIFALEEYIYIWNMSGNSWAEDWKMNPSGFDSKELSAEDEKRLSKINTLRADIYKKLSDFCDNFNGDTKAKSKAIYSFLVSEKLDKKFSEICITSEKEEDAFSASVQRQAWDNIMVILNSLVKILGTNVSAKDYSEAFRISASAVDISTVPQMLDEATFGSADRIRPSKPKVAIILGANQGIFPNNSVKSGLLASSEKQKLEAYGISLNDDEIKSAVEENYLVYSMLCCPVDKTFILYSENTLSGGALEPSAFINTVCNRVNAEITKYSPLSEELFYPVTEESAVYLMSDLYGDSFDTVRDSVKDASSLKNRIDAFDSKNVADTFLVSRENSKELFGDKIHLSASKFDDFHSCRLHYFLRYGLNTGKIRSADLNAAQRGTIVHFVLETLIKKYKKSFGELDERQISIAVDEAIEEYLSLISGIEVVSTPRFKFLISKISKAVKKVAFHMAAEFKQSDFEPAYCELVIGKDGDIPEMKFPIEDGEILLTGKIDRVDTYKNVIRIIDYKTGSKQFDFSDTLYGLNMQMLIYLYAVVKNPEKILEDARAGGILYLPAGGKALEASLAMNGLIVDDGEVISAMDKENKGKFIPEHNGKNQSFIDDETFNLVFSNIEKMIGKMGESIREGDFVPMPIDGLHSEACKYCEFAPVCRSSDKEHIKVKKLKSIEIKSTLKGEGEQNV